MELAVRVTLVGSALVVFSLVLVTGLGVVRGDLKGLSDEQQIHTQTLYCKRLCRLDARTGGYNYLRQTFSWQGQESRCLEFMRRYCSSFACRHHQGTQQAVDYYWSRPGGG